MLSILQPTPTITNFALQPPLFPFYLDYSVQNGFLTGFIQNTENSTQCCQIFPSTAISQASQYFDVRFQFIVTTSLVVCLNVEFESLRLSFAHIQPNCSLFSVVFFIARIFFLSVWVEILDGVDDFIVAFIYIDSHQFRLTEEKYNHRHKFH